MNRNHSALRALLIAGTTLLVTGAWADDPHAAKPSVADKVETKADKTAKDVKEAVDPSKAKTDDDRAARKAKQHDAQREKLATTWKGPVSDALRQELRRHAERVARLERIKRVADTEKDKASTEKAATLLVKENDRHEKWMSKNAPASPAAPAAPAADTKKEGAQ